MSENSLKLFTTLGELLDEYAKDKQMSQGDLARHLETSEATLRRWRKARVASLSDKQIKKLVEITKLSYEIFQRVCANYPVVVDLKYRRFETSIFDYGFVNKDVLRSGIPQVEALYGDKLDVHGKIEELIIGDDESNLELVFEYINNAYDKRLFINEVSNEMGLNWEPLVREAARSFPPLNFMLRDPRGFYCGHIITFPMQHVELEGKSYEYDLFWDPTRSQQENENQTEMVPIVSGDPHTFHVFSSWASNSAYVYYLLRRIARWIHLVCGEDITEDSCLTGFPTTDHAEEMFQALGLTTAGKPATRKRYYTQTKRPPQFYSIKFGEFVKKVYVDFRHDPVRLAKDEDWKYPRKVFGKRSSSLKTRQQDNVVW